jgi:hypothetical protein
MSSSGMNSKESGGRNGRTGGREGRKSGASREGAETARPGRRRSKEPAPEYLVMQSGREVFRRRSLTAALKAADRARRNGPCEICQVILRRE